MNQMSKRPVGSESSNLQPYTDESYHFEEQQRMRLAEVKAMEEVLDVEMANIVSNIEYGLSEFNQRLRRKAGLKNIRDRIHAMIQVPVVTTADKPKGMVESIEMDQIENMDGAQALVQKLDSLRRNGETS